MEMGSNCLSEVLFCSLVICLRFCSNVRFLLTESSIRSCNDLDIKLGRMLLVAMYIDSLPCFEIEIGNQFFLFSFIPNFSLNLSPYCLISPYFCLTLSTSSMDYLQNCVYRVSKFNLSQALLVSSVMTNLIVYKYNCPFFPKKKHTHSQYICSR